MSLRINSSETEVWAMPFIGMLEGYTETISVQCSIEMFGDRSVQMFEQLQSPIK
ncbi:hypothetical protein [Nostoc sp. UHCC 0252]|uniref:hypothetical protein n=1 Tax=Nostoc sp. UHCC 0252 TaxID=3110241 RepID=UPI002B1FBD67|nr:hypothetical protein [Nostoc sp. UHCC 0252]MEA5605104.1 hypothetical protein [Nostoc sp. UHCC 0252]